MPRKKRDFATARPPSVWDVDVLNEALDSINAHHHHGESLLTYLAHHPAVDEWRDVEWDKLKQRPPARLRDMLERDFSVRSSRIASRHDSKDGSTTKLVVELREGARVEAVVMRHGTLRSSRVERGFFSAWRKVRPTAGET